MKFGSHPSLPIAIERCLTEFVQGCNIYDYFYYNVLKKTDLNIEKYKRDVFLANFSSTIPVMYDEYFDNILNNKPEYEFSLSSWINENKKTTNKKMLTFLISNLKDMSRGNIFIRDNSFLGFPSYYIFIPDMSIIKNDYITREINFLNWINYKTDLNTCHNNIDTLIDALDFKLNYGYSQISFTKYVFVSPINSEYLLLLCYIVKNDIDKILKYSNYLQKTYNKKNKFLINMINEYYLQKKENKSKTYIDEFFIKKFSKEEISIFEKFIGNLSFDVIKKIIRNSNIRQNSNSNIHSAENLTNSTNNFNDKIEQIKNKMTSLYIENCPNQLNLKEVFNL